MRNMTFRRALPGAHQVRAAALAQAVVREAAPAPPKSAADDVDEEDRPKPTEGPDDLKVSGDGPATQEDVDNQGTLDKMWEGPLEVGDNDVWDDGV